MRDAAPTTIYLKDYKPFGYIVDSVDLDFALRQEVIYQVGRRIDVKARGCATAQTSFRSEHQIQRQQGYDQKQHGHDAAGTQEVPDPVITGPHDQGIHLMGRYQE